MIGIVIIGSALMFINLEDYVNPLRERIPEYTFPRSSELIYGVLFFLLYVVLYKIIKNFFYKRVGNWLEDKYLKEEDNGELYKEKVAIYMFKLLYLTCASIFGHYILRGLVFFPKSLFGNGEYRKMFQEGRDMFFFDKTPYFDLYYLANLGWAIFDTYLLCILPLQSDFPMMLLHHLATVSLVVFSYLINYSNIGCVVFYLHYFGDAFGYVLRIFIYVKVNTFLRVLSGVTVIIAFFYTRIYVFGYVIHDTYYFLNFDWGYIEYFCLLFKVFLYFLHIIWLSLILYKFCGYLFSGHTEELYKHKKNR